MVYYDEVAWPAGSRKPSASRHHCHARRGAARCGRRRPPHQPTSTLATRYGDVKRRGDRLRRCIGRRRAGLARGIRLPRVRERPGLTARRWSCSRTSTSPSNRPARRSRARMKEKGDEYGLVRREGSRFIIPGRGVAATEHDAHRDAARSAGSLAHRTLDGRDQADRCFEFLTDEFPGCFGKSRVRAYGYPGIRQTRWIVGRQQLTVDDVRDGTNFPDAIARTAWPIELHDHGTGHHWQTFPEDHTSLRAAREPDSRRCRQRRRRRALHRCRPCRAVERARHGSVHRHGRTRRRMRSISPAPAACIRSTLAALAVACLRQCGSRTDWTCDLDRSREGACCDGVAWRAPSARMRWICWCATGEALGAERLVETNNVAGAFNASTPSVRALAARGFDAVYSELNLDSHDVVEVPRDAR